MKDKEMIEEMAKDLNSSMAIMTTESFSDCLDIAKFLVGLDYRKLPKDSVVLTREEKQEYENLAKLFIYDKPIKSRVYEFIVETKEQARKETAEKIILFIKNYTTKMFHEYHKQRDIAESDYKKCKKEMFKAVLNNDWHRCDAIMYILESISTEIDELAKQFGVEIKE